MFEIPQQGIHIQWSDTVPHTNGLGTNIDGMTNGMVLNDSFNNWSPACRSMWEYCIRAIATHEFGHALGFAHEQNRPDTPPPPKCTEPPQGSNGDTTIGEWNLNSVMNYCNPDWNGNGNLSANDIRAAQKFYGYNFKNSDSVIGVIKHDESCFYEEVSIHMDDEDDNNTSKQVNTPKGISGGRNTDFVFCKEPFGGVYPELTHNSFNYAVIRFSENCPKGTFSTIY